MRSCCCRWSTYSIRRRRRFRATTAVSRGGRLSSAPRRRKWRRRRRRVCRRRCRPKSRDRPEKRRNMSRREEWMAPDIGLGNWFHQRALRTPERRALRFEGRDWTYADMQLEIEDCAKRLAALGVEKGDRVAFLGLNQPMFFFVMFGCARIGAIFVPLNFRLTGPELAFMIQDCAVRALIVDAQLRPVVEPQLASLSSLKTVLAAEEEAHWTPAPAPAVEHVPAREDDVALIMYTSGTTGRPKGAMLTHGNLWWNNTSAMHSLDTLTDDITIVCAPIFHIGGLNVTTLTALQKGALIVLHRMFDPGRVLADIVAHRATTMFGVPAMFLFMAQHPNFAT